MHAIDTLAYQAVFGTDTEKQQARFEIWQKGIEAGIIPSSIHDLYIARGTGKVPNTFTVPAINLRGMVYDTARALFQAAKEYEVGALICEIARSEMGYTAQSPQEYVSVVTAAALREGWSGPLFIQGDHFQAKAAGPGKPKDGEIDTIVKLIHESVAAGFYNIDIDMSTLVDLEKPAESDQQIPNYTYSSQLAEVVRAVEPEGVTVSLGAEIGHVGGRNSTVADFTAFMEGFSQKLPENMTGISKISVQTGTDHGGKVLADGTLADIDVDFTILRDITATAQSQYQIGGAVQHGASTLPDKYFNQFVQFHALEVHLATGFQNLTFDHPAFPKELLDEIYAYADEHFSDERSAKHTDQQFHYSLRKKAWGPFKQKLWEMPEENRRQIRESLSERFAFFFTALSVQNTQSLIRETITPVVVPKTLADFAVSGAQLKDVKGLAD